VQKWGRFWFLVARLNTTSYYWILSLGIYGAVPPLPHACGPDLFTSEESLSLLSCWHVALSCWYVALSCWHVALSCLLLKSLSLLSCWHVALSCWHVALSCWYVALSCLLLKRVCHCWAADMWPWAADMWPWAADMRPWAADMWPWAADMWPWVAYCWREFLLTIMCPILLCSVLNSQQNVSAIDSIIWLSPAACSLMLC
jgi:hypothetical protein